MVGLKELRVSVFMIEPFSVGHLSCQGVHAFACTYNYIAISLPIQGINKYCIILIYF